MAAPRNRKHLLVSKLPATEAYTPHARKITPEDFPRPKDRQSHARSLSSALEQAALESKHARETQGVVVQGTKPGVYVQFQGPADVGLKLQSLEDRRKGIELMAVHETVVDGKAVEQATVFVPEGSVPHFLSRFEQYAAEKTKKGQPRHKELVDRIETLRKAALRDLWTEALEPFPSASDIIWWEVWLKRDEGRELERLLNFAGQAELTIGERRLAFEDRSIVLVRASAEQLAAALDVLNDVAELRHARESGVFFVDLSPSEQADWVEDLRERTSPPPHDAPAVCLLDTGVTRAHPLLENVIAATDATAVDLAWGSNDNGGGPDQMGHGTQMAGLAVYGDLAPLLAGDEPVFLKHRLESVKILPPVGTNQPDLYGAITAQAVARPEITEPGRQRTFSLAVTATNDRDRGQPSSWSAAVDALAAGRSFDPVTNGLVYLDQTPDTARRLFVISAGNTVPTVSELEQEYLNRCDLMAVHDPAQAWNALTVGCFTEKAFIQDGDYGGWSPLAPPGDLSPWSTTSVTFQEMWPYKPDVVYEGGNVGVSGDAFDTIPDLCLLTTYYRPAQKPLVLSWATSAATAQVARMAAMIHSEYPAFWPETVRALLVHSARWTPAMQTHLRGASGKRGRARLIRRYGFGVPELSRALKSADDDLTLVMQSTVHPFLESRMREMQVFELPWPKIELEELGDATVRLRVTLSYFVEPNPGRRGWKTRYRYASHGLRFDLKSPTETVHEFRKRLNQRALDEEEEKPSGSGDSSAWYLGAQTRSRGSVHSDLWTGTAADLAECGFIGVYPVSGWWKDQPKRDRSDYGARYALLVGIETEAQAVDIWTPVAQQIGIPVEILVDGE